MHEPVNTCTLYKGAASCLALAIRLSGIALRKVHMKHTNLVDGFVCKQHELARARALLASTKQRPLGAVGKSGTSCICSRLPKDILIAASAAAVAAISAPCFSLSTQEAQGGCFGHYRRRCRALTSPRTCGGIKRPARVLDVERVSRATTEAKSER